MTNKNKKYYPEIEPSANFPKIEEDILLGLMAEPEQDVEKMMEAAEMVALVEGMAEQEPGAKFGFLVGR